MERAERMRHSDAPRSIEPVPAVTGNGIARRTIQVARAAWRHLLIPAMRRRDAAGGGERARAFLEDLGGTWIKLGQALALRFDLLPADYCLQFFQLLNQVRPFPSAGSAANPGARARAAGCASCFAPSNGSRWLPPRSARCIAPSCRTVPGRRQDPAAGHSRAGPRRPAADALDGGDRRSHPVLRAHAGP